MRQMRLGSWRAGAGLVVGTLLAVSAVPPVAAAAAGGPCRVAESGSATASYSDVQTALDSAQSGDTLTIQGTCVGNFAVGAKTLTLQGKGRATLDGGATGSVLWVDAGATITVSNLTITHGNSTTGGGGLTNFGELTLTNALVTANTSSVGGGGVANSGSIAIMNSSIAGNSASAAFDAGGAIVNWPSGSATVTGSQLTANAAFIGGGIDNYGSLTISKSTIADNTAAQGGGIDASGSYGGSVDIADSTISGNHVTGDSSHGLVANGGGILFFGGTMTVVNTVLSGNIADRDGGAIDDEGGTLVLDGATIGTRRAPNTAGNFGGGISNALNANAAATLIFQNAPTVLDYNTAATQGGAIYTSGSTGGGTVVCGSPSLVVYGTHNSPDDSYDSVLGSDTVCQ